MQVISYALLGGGMLLLFASCAKVSNPKDLIVFDPASLSWGVLFRVMVRPHFCSIDGRVLLGAFFGGMLLEVLVCKHCYLGSMLVFFCARFFFSLFFFGGGRFFDPPEAGVLPKWNARYPVVNLAKMK